MKHIHSEITHGNEAMARAFVLAAFERKQLAEQIDILYESVDTLGATLDVESRHKLFENTSGQMKKLGARLAEIEQQLNEMLPEFIEFNEQIEQKAVSPHAAADTTLSFESERPNHFQPQHRENGAASGNSSELTNEPECGIGRPLHQRLQMKRLEPEKPTLIATEPAPMLNEDDDTYQFEDDDDYDLPNEDVFDSPLGELPSTEPDPIVPESAESPEDDMPSVLNEDSAGETPHSDAQLADAQHAEDDIDASEITEPVLIRQNDDDSDDGCTDAEDIANNDTFNNDIRPSSMTPQEQADESWNSVSSRPFNPKETIRYGDERQAAFSREARSTSSAPLDNEMLNSTTLGRIELIRKSPSQEISLSASEQRRTHQSEAATSVAPANDDSPVNDGSPVNDAPQELATLLEPEDDIAPAAVLSQDTNSMRDTLDDEMQTVPDDLTNPSETMAQSGDEQDKNILFWRQGPPEVAANDVVSPVVSPNDVISPDVISPNEVITAASDPIAPMQGQFVLSRIPSLFPGNPISQEQLIETVDDALNHIQNYDETDDETDITHADGAVEIDDDEYDGHIDDNGNPLERELYEMLDIHAAPSQSAVPAKTKQTLIGITPIEDAGPNGAEADDRDTSATPTEETGL